MLVLRVASEAHINSPETEKVHPPLPLGAGQCDRKSTRLEVIRPEFDPDFVWTGCASLGTFLSCPEQMECSIQPCMNPDPDHGRGSP